MTADCLPVLVPRADDEADVRAGLDEADRGELLSPEESAEYLRVLVGQRPSAT